MDESFCPGNLPEIPQPGQTQKIDCTNALTRFLVHQQHGVGQVLNRPELSFSYVDREIIPARTTGRARYADGRPPATGTRLDWLLVNREDRRPIIAEVKVGNDMNPFYALIQTLMYAAELATFNQATRLQQHYDQVRFPELANSQEDVPPAIDIYLILSNYDRTNQTRTELLDVTERLCERLVKEPIVRTHIRRIACLDAHLNDAGQLCFSSSFCHPAVVAP